MKTPRWASAACTVLLIVLTGAISAPLAAEEADDTPEIVALDRQEAMNQMKQLGLGMQSYHNEHKSLPPPALVDGDGKPLLSWRVALLPYLEEDYTELYGEFHLDEPWDSEHNKPLIAKMPAIYRCRRSKKADAGMTVYQVPRGASTAFAGPDGIPSRKITDGLSNTIGVVEVDEAHAAPWTKPEDFRIDLANPAKGLGGHFPQDIFLCMFCDGSARAIPTTAKKDGLRALFTRDGGEIFDPNDL